MVVTRQATDTSENSTKEEATTQVNSQGLNDCPKDTLDINMASIENKTAPMQQPEWFKEVSQKLSIIDTLGNKLADISNKLDEVKDSVNFACESAKNAMESARNAEKISITLQNENAQLKNDIASMQTRIVQMESQSRRNNLIFNGIREKMGKETWEDCEASVKDILGKTLGINGAPTIQFERVHRLGPKKADKTRSIIARLSSFKDRELIWKNRHKLSKSNLSILEDYPAEIQNERKLLFPILKVLKTLDHVESASLKLDKLYINGKWYTSKTLHELPPNLKLQTLFTRSGNGVTLFCSKYSPLSNLYSEAKFTIDGEQYISTEQYIQHAKATLFHDDLTAAQIKAETNPYTIMGLGKMIKGFKPATWKKDVHSVLKKACLAKFHQVAFARETLLATNNDLIGEATLDKTFGIGLHLTDEAAKDPTNWLGENMFGNILLEIRNELKKHFTK